MSSTENSFDATPWRHVETRSINASKPAPLAPGIAAKRAAMHTEAESSGTPKGAKVRLDYDDGSTVEYEMDRVEVATFYDERKGLETTGRRIAMVRGRIALK